MLQENLKLGGPDGPHMAYWRAGALAAVGRTNEARTELEKVDSYPYEFELEDLLSSIRDPKDRAKLPAILESLDT